MAITAKDLSALRKEAKILEQSHGGYTGKSLIEKVRGDLDVTVEELQNDVEKVFNGDVDSGIEYKQGLADGIAHALGIFRSSSMDCEISESIDRIGLQQAQQAQQAHVVVAQTDAP